MNNPVLIVERPDAATAVLTLNRPQQRNALSMELLESLCTALESLTAESQRRIVILQGAGPAFCAGLDLHEAAQPEAIEKGPQRVARVLEALLTSPLVTIAAAHGAAYAGGAGLMACCDLVVAADDLRICFPEVRHGLVPALVSGPVRARLREADFRRLVLLAEPIDAQQALAIGLVDYVVPLDQVAAQTHGLVASLLKGGPDAVRQTKRLLRALRSVEPAEFFAQALEFHRQARLSDEAREGLAAFAQRRAPAWSPDAEARGETTP